MLKLEGRVAVITGSDSGMGQAMAEEFARAGASIAITFVTTNPARRRQAAGCRRLAAARWCESSMCATI
jgi:glucose 1-dehydrogenase